EADNRFVRRKSVSEVKTPKHLAAIRDNTIRETLTAHLLARGADPAKPFPKGIFEGDNTPLMKSGVPVRKVRMVETMSTVRPAGKHRQFQFVQPGSNHHICYYETTDRKGNPKWNARVTTMWDAAQRVRLEGGEAIDRSD